ncbi:MAG: anhydro-N-acetylmuramic acid kinase [Pseudomonadota bacterium]|nr:anhydro-N-acetylmuramic acid kinase [Pseudomonadota bacterium]
MRHFIGLMSGTSADAIDAALVGFESDGTTHLVCTHTLELPTDLKTRIIAAQTRVDTTIRDVCEQDVALSLLYAAAVEALIEKAKVPVSEIEAIGNHGQTLLHAPEVDHPFTLQIGDNHRLAELSGITVVGDFRRRDIAVGGQGAPLVPAFHRTLVSRTETAAFLNVGGIANVSVIAPGRVSGFDTGPGNTLSDAWIRKHQQQAFDASGAWASTGTVNESLLERMLADPYFSRPAPKSTGQDYFNLTWLESLKVDELAPVDVQRTLVELTARSASDALRASGCEQVYLCGGGRHNNLLTERIKSLLAPIEAADTSALGIDADFMEAVAFAWLAKQCLDRASGNVPAVTGAQSERVLGVIYPRAD